MPIGLLRGIAGRALGLGGRAVDDVLNPVLRNARIKAGNILQQQLNPLSRQAAVRTARNIGPRERAAFRRSLTEDNPVKGTIVNTAIAAKAGVANPAVRNTLIAPAAGLATAGTLQAVNSAPANSIEQRLNQVGPAIDNFIGGLNFPGQRALEKYGKEQESRGLGAALDLVNPLGFLVAPFIPNSISMTPLERRNLYGDSGDMDAGATRVSFQSDRVAPAVLNGIPGIVDVNPQTGEMLPGTWRRGDMDAGPGRVSEMNDPSQADYVAPTVFPPAPTLPAEERAYQTELARTQQMAAANPYFQQMDLYAQGQRAMQTQEDMNKVRDLGLAINAAKFGTPEQRMQQTVGQVNSLMAGLTPPGPAQPVIPMDEEGRIGQLDAAAAGVQDFMRKYAEGMKKRKGEE